MRSKDNLFNHLSDISKQLEDTLAAASHKLFVLIVEMARSGDTLSLSKADLLTSLKQREGEIGDANFRKRISQINKDLTEHDLKLKLNNTKTSVDLKFDDVALEQISQQQTLERLKQLSKAEHIDESRTVTSMASMQPFTKVEPQVLMSYAWDKSPEQLSIQQEVAERLEAALASPGAKYSNQPKVKLFIDISKHNGFTMGEDQSEQQNIACAASQVCLLLYTNKYLTSAACQTEVDYFLTPEGSNKPGKLTLIAPFSVAYGEMDVRYQKNLAASVEQKFEHVLALFESGSETDKNNYINALVSTIYTWLMKEQITTKPYFDPNSEHDPVRAALKMGAYVDLDSDKCETAHAKDKLSANNSGAIDIVDHLKKWALSDAPSTQRLFYLLGDFGAGKSTSCQLLTQIMMQEYESSQHNDQQKVLPIYLDLKRLLNALDSKKSNVDLPIEGLLEEMLRQTGAPEVQGQQVVKFIRTNPCLVIFDGFDEIGQKLDEKQQVGLLNKMLGLLPKDVYADDLKRMANPEEPLESKHGVPLQTRIVISCRTHFFNSLDKEQAFRNAYYRSQAGEQQGEIKNYQNYYLVPFSKQQIKNYLVNWLGASKGQRAATFIETVHDLSGLSEKPIMLRLIKDLIPSLQEKARHHQHINAATLYNDLFQQIGHRDVEKHLIALDEKQQLLSHFAVYLWHMQSHEINKQILKDWFIGFKSQLPIMSADIASGKYSIDILLQDLHNASLLVRDGEDNYRFTHTSFFEYFLACGIFEIVRLSNTHANTHVNTRSNQTQGFDLLNDQQHKLSLNAETKQFLLDWRQTTNPHYRKQFDQNWQELQQQACSTHSKAIGFDIWLFAYKSKQDFPQAVRPNWSGLTLTKLKLHGENAKPLNLVSADLSGCDISESDFKNVNFANADLQNALLRQNYFDACNFTGIKQKQTNFNANRFMTCQGEQNWWQEIAHAENNATLNFVMSKASLKDKVKECHGVLKFTERYSWIDSITYSPDGKSFASTSNDGKLKLWDIPSQTCIAILGGQNGRVSAISYSSDSKSIISGGHDGKVKLWDLASKTCVVTLEGHSHEIMAVSSSPDGKSVFSVASDGTIKFWDIASQSCIASLVGHYNELSSVSFSPDGKSVVLGGKDGLIRFRDLASQVCSATLEGHYGRVNAVVYSQDGKLAVSCGSDRMLKLWDLANKNCIGSIESQGRSFYSLAISPDSRTIASGDFGGQLKFWDVASLTCSASINGYSNWITSLVYSPDSTLIVSGGMDGKITFWDSTSHTCVTNIAGHSLWASKVNFSPDGKSLVSIQSDGNINVLDIASQTCSEIFKSSNFWEQPTAFSPDGNTLVSGQADGKLKIWDSVSESCIAIIVGPNNSVSSLVYSTDGKLVASGGSDGTIKIWDITYKTCIATLEGHDGRITSLLYSPDGKSLTSVGRKRDFKLWDITSQTCRVSLNDRATLIQPLGYSPDSKSLFCAGQKGEFKLWDIASQSYIANFEGHKGIVSVVAYSPDGKSVASGTTDGEIKLWHIASQTCYATLKGSALGIETLTFSPDGRSLVSAGDEGIQIWDVASKELLTSWVSFPKASVVFGPQMSPRSLQGDVWKYLTLVTNNPDGTVSVAAPSAHPDWQRLYQA